MKKLFNMLIILSILATPHLVINAYARRGYFAIGGEWFVIPLILLAYMVTGQVILLYKECFNTQNTPTAGQDK